MTEQNHDLPQPIRSAARSQARFRAWSHVLISALFADPVCTSIVETLRQQLGLADPADASDVSLNLHIASRDHVAACVRRHLQANADKYEDHRILSIIPLTLNWEAMLQLTDTDDDKSEDPELIEALRSLEDAIKYAINASALPDLAIDFFVEHITDRVIEGALAHPRPLPAFFRSKVVPLSFADDTMLFAYVTRFGDIDEITEELRLKFREYFVPGKRDRWPGKTDRDTWVLSRHALLKDAMQSNPALSDGSTYDEATLYDHLLNDFMGSPYAHDFDHYDIDTAEGQKLAKARLRKIVNDQHNRFRKELNQAEENARTRDADSYP